MKSYIEFNRELQEGVIEDRTRTKTHTHNSLFHTAEWSKVRNGQYSPDHEKNVEEFRKFADDQGFEFSGWPSAKATKKKKK